MWLLAVLLILESGPLNDPKFHLRLWEEQSSCFVVHLVDEDESLPEDELLYLWPPVAEAGLGCLERCTKATEDFQWALEALKC